MKITFKKSQLKNYLIFFFIMITLAVVVLAVDFPLIVINYPANNSIVSGNVNFSVNVTNGTNPIRSVLAEISGVNYTMTKSYCYQEFANQSTSCGGLANGNYSYSGDWDSYPNIIDGSWSTGSNAGVNKVAYLYINYSKPANALNTSLWQHSYNIVQNITIPQNCWNQNTLQFRIYRNTTTGLNHLNSTCFDGADWIIANYTFGAGDFDEEAMWWDLGTYNYNRTINVDGNWTVYANDTLNNWNHSDRYYYTLTIPPSVVINYPANNSVLTGNTNFSVNITNGSNPISSVLAEIAGINYTLIHDYCYQEFANVSTICGGVAGGNYSFSGVITNQDRCIDGIWSQFCNIDPDKEGVMFSNYSKPIGALSTSLWRYADGGMPAGSSINISIPSDCFNQNMLQFRISFNSTGGSYQINGTCFDGANWLVLRYRTTNLFYEEAMWWDLGTYNYNRTITTTGNWTSYVNDTAGNWNHSDRYYFTVIGNVAPIFSLINITPTTAFRDTPFTCNFNASDDINLTMNASIDFYVYSGGAWAKNTSFQRNGYINNTINSTTLTTRFAVDDEIYCNVTVGDGSLDTRNKSNTVTIITSKLSLNASFPSVNLSPAVPYTTSVIICNASYSSAKNATFYLNTSFYVNNLLNTSVLLTNYANNSLRSVTLTTRYSVGNVIYCNMTANDGADIITNKSNSINITNRLPAVYLINMSPSTAYRDTFFTCNFNATDYENSTLSLNTSFYINNIFSFSILNSSYINNSLVSVVMGAEIKNNSAVIAENLPFNGYSWSTPSNALSENGVYTDLSMGTTDISDYLEIRNFSFNIPLNSTIQGIQIDIKGYYENDMGDGSVEDSEIKLIKNNNTVGNSVNLTNWPSSNSFMIHGGSTNLWGTTWLPSEINNDTFGATIRSLLNVGSGTTTAHIDYVKATIFYRLNYSLDVGDNVSCNMTANDGFDSVVNQSNIVMITNRLPVASLNSPANNSAVENLPNVTFSFNVTDGDLDIMRCNLTYNGTILNESILSNGTVFNYTFTFPFNQYNKIWNVSCWDGYNRTNSNNYNISLLRDIVAPTVSSLSPANYSVTYLGTLIDFIFLPADNINLSNCSLFTNQTGNWAANKTLIGITNGSNNTIQASFSEVRNITWGIACYDNLNNLNFSLNRTILIKNNTPPIVTFSSFDPGVTGQQNSIKVIANDPDTEDSAFNCFGRSILNNGTELILYQQLTRTGGDEFHSEFITLDMDSGFVNTTTNCTDPKNATTTNISRKEVLNSQLTINSYNEENDFSINFTGWINLTSRDYGVVNVSVLLINKSNGVSLITDNILGPQQGSNKTGIWNSTNGFILLSANYTINYTIYVNASNLITPVVSSRDFEVKDIVVTNPSNITITPKERTTSYSFNISIYTFTAANLTYNFTVELDNSSFFNISLAFNNTNIGYSNSTNPILNLFRFNANSTAPDGIYYGNVTITRQTDGKKWIIPIAVYLNPPAGAITLLYSDVPYTKCTDSSESICSEGHDVYDSAAPAFYIKSFTYTIRSNNTGNFTISNCSIIPDPEGAGSYSFTLSAANFSLNIGETRDTTVTFRNFVQGGINNIRITGWCGQSTTLGYPAGTSGDNQPLVEADVTVYSPPSNPAGGGGGAGGSQYFLQECSENIDCEGDFGLGYICFDNKCILNLTQAISEVTTISCGNNFCEPELGEDYRSCSSDCRFNIDTLFSFGRDSIWRQNWFVALIIYFLVAASVYAVYVRAVSPKKKKKYRERND